MLTRKVHFDLYKDSGKWYAGGEAFVDPSENYFDDELLMKHIDETQKEVGSIYNQMDIVITEIDDGPFIRRIIHMS